MKKGIFSLLVLLSIFLFSGCSINNNKDYICVYYDEVENTYVLFDEAYGSEVKEVIFYNDSRTKIIFEEDYIITNVAVTCYVRDEVQ